MSIPGMDSLPSNTDPMLESVVVRTDFSDPTRWEAARAAMSTPSVDGFLAGVEFVDDPRLADVRVERLLELATEGWRRRHACLFIADATALGSDEWPVLYVELHSPDAGRAFRVAASALWSVENNLSLANMDLEDFTNDLDDDGVYRGS